MLTSHFKNYKKKKQKVTKDIIRVHKRYAQCDLRVHNSSTNWVHCVTALYGVFMMHDKRDTRVYKNIHMLVFNIHLLLVNNNTFWINHFLEQLMN